MEGQENAPPSTSSSTVTRGARRRQRTNQGKRESSRARQNGALDPFATEFRPTQENGSAGLSRTAGRNRKGRGGSRKGKVDWRTLGSGQQKKEEHTVPDGHQDESMPICILCCEPMEVMSFGECNHWASCYKCCLRLRMCYDNTECPMCKKELRDIVIAPWRKSMPKFSEYVRGTLPYKIHRVDLKLGPGVVMVDDPPGRSQKLLNELLGMVSLSCSKCSTTSRKRYKNAKQLMDHMQKQHSTYMCKLCLDEKRVFPLDLETYPSVSALKKHKKEKHPECRFCNRTRFYDSDALWHHLTQHHFRCMLCDQDGAHDAWYRNAPELQLHLSHDHFACDHDNCRACLVAFHTLDELQEHHMQHHSGRMRRWDRSQSRPLEIDISYRPNSTRAVENSRAFDREARGGLEVIDDDFGMLSLAEASSWRGAVPPPSREEHFPSLGDTIDRSHAERTASDRKLVSHAVRCPCGRRKTHHVVPEGDDVPILECDAICRLEDRKNRLDDAFGIDRSRHISVFNRRKASWNGTLLKAAKDDIATIQMIEKELEDFVRSSSNRRQMAPSPKSQRAILHMMAEQYGITTASTGSGPNRAVQLFRGTSCGLPDRLLSSVSPTVSEEEIAKLLLAAEGFQLKFVDIAPTVDLHYFLRQFESHYTLSWPSSTTAIATFDEESVKQAVVNQLGGGIRGLFRIDHAWEPRIAINVSDASSSSSHAPWATQANEQSA
ncbi:hypothetical protein M9435_004243 [Picochlorum sp. BPE23]|nr:hypothetical protein M9435_004243 [Picochlorum sp. BPE23]